MFESTVQWLRDKYSALTVAHSSDPKEKEAEEARKKFSDAFDEFSDFFDKIANKLEKDGYLQQFNLLGESFRKSGYRAGHWGIREKDIGGMAVLQVLITKNQIQEECQSNQRLLESQVTILDEIMTNAKRDYKNKNSYYEKLNRSYQYSHRQFSLVLGLIYGFFCVTLILADIPLALQLTKKGFSLASDTNNPLSSLFLYGTAEGFYTHFFRVLTANWEVVLFAMGIAFCTIYIKIFYDDFIGIPLENLIKKSSESPIEDFEEFHVEFHKNIDENSSKSVSDEIKEERRIGKEKLLVMKKEIAVRFNRLWWGRFGVKVGILLMLLSTIIILGVFRYYAKISTVSDDIPGSVTFLTYTLLTLLFPIISGICGSLSLNCFHNLREIRKAEKEKREAQKNVEKATDNFRVKEEEKESNKSILEWLKSPENINQMKDYLIFCYESGYKFGYLHPEWMFGGDLFARAEALRQRNLIKTDNPPSSTKAFEIKGTFN